MSESFATEMNQLRADVAAQSSVIASATAAFRGLATQLQTAETAATNAGATAEQIASLAAFRTSLEANTASLANAIPANTPVPVMPAAPAMDPANAPQPVVTAPVTQPAETGAQPQPADPNVTSSAMSAAPAGPAQQS